jgi:hypothetical protein
MWMLINHFQAIKMYDLWTHWIYGFTNIELAFGFIGSMIVIGCSSLYVFNRFFERRFGLGLETNEAIGFFGECAGVAYGILIGLTAVACWDNFEETQRIIGKETASIGQFHRLTYGIDGDLEELRQLNLRYLQLIVTDEIPLIVDGLTCDAALGTLKDIREKLYALTPRNLRNHGLVRL